MRRAIEQAILSTLLNTASASEKDFDMLIDYKLDYKLFNANRTHTLVAKALFNHAEDGLVWDELLIHNYILKKTKLEKTKMNEQEYSEINNKVSLPFTVFLRYIEDLNEMETNRIINERLKRL